MKKVWDKWKQKWGVETDKRMVWIFIIFAITGSFTVIVRKSLFSALNISIENKALDFAVRILAIYVVYQIMLFTIGSIMGEHKFVKWFILKMNRRLIPSKSTKHDGK